MEEIEDLRGRNCKWGPACAAIQRKCEVDVNTIGLEQMRHNVGIFAAAPGVNGTKTGVFKDIIEGFI